MTDLMEGPSDPCWYCYSPPGDDLEFSWEFDTWVHLSCIKDSIATDPSDQEAQILARELIPGYAATNPPPTHYREANQAKRRAIDHVIPRSRGGVNRIENYQLLCGPCNRWKATKTIDYRPNGLQATAGQHG